MTSLLRNRSSIVLLALALLGSAAGGEEAAFYVHTNNVGNDHWSGRRPDSVKADGPFGTVNRARIAVREYLKEHPGQPVTVYLGDGIHPLAEPLVFGLEDSGSESGPVTWAAYKDAHPVISGGVPINGWQKTSVNGREAWVAKLPANDPNAFLFRELWLNGQRLQRARWPKKGTLAVAETKKAKTHADWRHSEGVFPFNAGDIKAWSSAADGEVLLTSRWVAARLPIQSIDEASHTVTSTKLSGFHPETDDRYFIENIKENLTDPGEWYLDPRERAVYLIPPTGVASPESASVIAPVLPRLITLVGDASKDRFVRNIVFKGLSFSHSEWYYDHVAVGEKADPTRAGSSQADIGVGAAVDGKDLRHCVFDHCSFAHIGGYALSLGVGCQDNRITHCTFTDLAAGGVKIGEPGVRDKVEQQCFGNKIADCRITDGGYLFPSGVGVWIGQSHDNTLSHCEIANFWYSGISVGWTWGYGKALSQNNHIEYNDIHHIGIKHDGDLPILSDMGGIYTLGNEKGTLIHHNHFHDIAALKYGGWGIYFDEGTTDIIAENNLVNRTSHAGFHQHYGKDNIVRNNIFAYGRESQIQRTRLEDHTSITFEKNIVIWNSGLEVLHGNFKSLQCNFDNNTYWHEGPGDILFSKKTFPKWQAFGADAHSIIANPGFKDPEHGDFTLGSTDKLPGFRPFDLSTVGPRE